MSDYDCQCTDHHHQVTCLQIAWWERPFVQWCISFSVLLFSWLLLYGGVRIVPNLWLSLAAIFAVVAGLAFDVYLTRITLDLKPKFDRIGVFFPVYEGNRLLPNYPTLQQQILSLPTLIAIGTLIVTYFVPPFGFAACTLHLLAAASWVVSRRNLLKSLEEWEHKHHMWLGGEGTPVPNS